MSFWGEIVGQADAVELLQRVSSPAGRADLTHAWLITGPPGSGRFNVAQRFAAAIVAGGSAPAAAGSAPAVTPDAADAAEAGAGAAGVADSAHTVVDPSEEELTEQLRLVTAGTHPDVKTVRAVGNDISVAAMREAVAGAYFAPAQSQRRVIIVEDADRMNVQAANATLKALEEPPATTVWILCAPSEADLLSTIRSRTRTVRLTTPSVAKVSSLLGERDGIDPALAAQAAKLAQGHIGMARHLASSPEAFARRAEIVETVLRIQTLDAAMAAAATVFQLAKDDAAGLIEAQAEQSEQTLRQSLGLSPTQAVPREFQSHFRALAADEKRRQSRSIRDAVDRILLDILTVYRDTVSLLLETAQPLINEQHESAIKRHAADLTLPKGLAIATAFETARTRLARGITPELTLEAAFASQIALRHGATLVERG